MKWFLLFASISLILAAGVVTDFYFHPQKGIYDEHRGFYSQNNNPTTWTGAALAVDGLFLGVWSVCFALPKKP